jgi:hypothetical protein
MNSPSFLTLTAAEHLTSHILYHLYCTQVSKYPEMGDTRCELRLLKTVWDMKALVLGTHDSWNQQVRYCFIL